MRTAGIICEYNPFHPGHRFHLMETRRRLGPDTGILCLMSGNYVQRGEPAIFDKWSRAKTAVENGADLVLELPITVAINAAGYFADGAVACLDALGCVDDLCFGSECGDLPLLQRTAELLCTPKFETALRQQLETGVSYARAREWALRSLGGNGQCLTTANNALGVDYLRSLLLRGSTIRPMTVQRDLTQSTASDLRLMLSSGWRSHGETFSWMLDRPMHTMEYGERAILATLKNLDRKQFEQMPFGSEGLWSKVMKACQKEMCIHEIILACKSKRYTYSRLRRMLLCLFLGLSETDLHRPVPYLRALAFNDKGRQLLRNIAETGKLPIVSGAVPNFPDSKAYFALESRATDLYGLFVQPGVVEPSGREKATPPAYVRSEDSSS